MGNERNHRHVFKTRYIGTPKGREYTGMKCIVCNVVLSIDDVETLCQQAEDINTMLTEWMEQEERKEVVKR